MPHVSDVRSTSHDRHDPLLVAALAADDLAGTDRDQATELIHSCAGCATLHDDLVAIARAVASAPPPVATRPRDFRLTPADAARLRPAGWRRFVGALSSLRPTLTRPLGVGLATLGLIGLLVGNVQLGSSAGNFAAAPGAPTTRAAAVPAASAASAPSALGGDSAAGPPSSATPQTPPQAPVAAGSGADLAASAAPEYGTADRSAPPGKNAGGIAAPAASGSAAALGESSTNASTASGTADPLRLPNLLSGGAVILGLIVLVMSRRRRRATA